MANNTTETTLMSPDSVRPTSLHCPNSTIAADKPPVVKVMEVNASSDDQQWLESVNKPLIPEVAHWGRCDLGGGDSFAGGRHRPSMQAVKLCSQHRQVSADNLLRGSGVFRRCGLRMTLCTHTYPITLTLMYICDYLMTQQSLWK